MSVPPLRVRPNDGQEVWIEVRVGDWEPAVFDLRHSNFSREGKPPLRYPDEIVAWSANKMPPDD